ncbi:MAG: hypothetical protein ACI4V7_10425, partial [Succinivibrionaceae bacterium]
MYKFYLFYLSIIFITPKLEDKRSLIVLKDIGKISSLKTILLYFCVISSLNHLSHKNLARLKKLIMSICLDQNYEQKMK